MFHNNPVRRWEPLIGFPSGSQGTIAARFVGQIRREVGIVLHDAVIPPVRHSRLTPRKIIRRTPPPQESQVVVRAPRHTATDRADFTAGLYRYLILEAEKSAPPIFLSMCFLFPAVGETLSRVGLFAKVAQATLRVLLIVLVAFWAACALLLRVDARCHIDVRCHIGGSTHHGFDVPQSFAIFRRFFRREVGYALRCL